MNRFLLVLTFTLFMGQIVRSQGLPKNVPTNGLVAYYSFNGNADDISVNDNNGIVSGANLTSDKNGTLDNAYEFTVNANGGWGSPQQEITVDYVNNMNTNSITLSAWVYPRTKYAPFADRPLTIFGRWAGGVSNEVFRFQITYDQNTSESAGAGANKIFMQLSNASSNGNTANDSKFFKGGDISFNQWTHVAVTYDGQTGKVFQNGALVSEELINVNMNTGVSALNIGSLKASNGTWYLFDGKLDELGYWNRALTAEEISSLFNESAGILLNGSVSAENNQIKNVADPTDQQDAVTKAYLETEMNDEKPNIEQVLEKGNNANGIQLKNLADPTDDQDAVTLGTLLQKISELQDQLDVLNTSNVTGIMYDLEGNEYGTILMCDGKQWTTNYLNVSFFENGDPIPEVTENDAWRDLNSPAYCYLNNQDRGRGKIYNWFAVNDSRGLAPEGWHIATEDEWNQLINCLGGVEVAGGKLKMSGTEYWESPNVGSSTTGMASNSSGMGLLPDGFREGANGNFYSDNEFVSIWNKSDIDDRRPYVILLNNLAKINLGLTDPYDGAHILLIKDYE